MTTKTKLVLTSMPIILMLALAILDFSVHSYAAGVFVLAVILIFWVRPLYSYIKELRSKTQYGDCRKCGKQLVGSIASPSGLDSHLCSSCWPQEYYPSSS